jgi:hypothetical protein
MTYKSILRGLRQIVRYSGDFLKDLTARREAKRMRARKALGLNINSDSKTCLLQLFAITFLGDDEPECKEEPGGHEMQIKHQQPTG